MSTSYEVSYVGDGITTNYAVVPDYIRKNHLFVSLNGVPTTAYTFFNDQTIQFNTAPGAGVVIDIVRRPPGDVPLNIFTGSVITPTALNENFRQAAQLGTISQDDAALARSTSQTALTTAQSAVVTANAATVIANQSVSDAAASVIISNQAANDAASAVSTANQANSNAVAAVITANAAEATANGIAATANLALSNSTAAVSTANTANTNSSNAVVASNNAIILASQAISLGQKAFIDLYNLAVGLPGSKIIDLGDLTSGCSSDYFTGEDGGTSNYNCAIGCSLTDLGTV